MLDVIRNKMTGTLTWIIMALIGFAFAFFGLNDYFGGRGQSNQTAAKVNGEKISWRQVDILYDRMQRQLPENMEASMVKNQLRQVLIQRLALLSAAQKLGLKVGDKQVVQTLLHMPAFQAEGKFSKDKYLQVLQEASYKETEFREELSRDLVLAQLEQGLVLSSIGLPEEIKKFAELLEQKRDVSYFTISPQKFKNKPLFTQEMLQAYYDANRMKFIQPEDIQIEYVDLSLENLAKNISPSEDELKAYYKEHTASYSVPERVQARHILIAQAKSANDSAADNKAREKAEELLKQLKIGADFAALAKKHSQDDLSAKKGGDLGYFARGQMVPEFEKAVFAAKLKEIIGPIRTDFGYHLVQIMEHKDAETQSFETVRSLVRDQVAFEKAQTAFNQKADQLEKLAFEHRNNLRPIAEAMDLKVQESGPLTAKGGKEAITQNPLVIKAAFEEHTKQGNNSEPIKIAANQLLVIRGKNYHPSKQLNLTEVQSQVEELLTKEANSKQARDLAESIVSKIKQGSDAKQIAQENNITWINKTALARGNTEIDKQIVQQAFSADPGTKARFHKLASGDFLVLKINKIIPGDYQTLDAQKQQQYKSTLTDMYGQLEFALYMNDTLGKADIKLLNKDE